MYMTPKESNDVMQEVLNIINDEKILNPDHEEVFCSVNPMSNKIEIGIMSNKYDYRFTESLPNSRSLIFSDIINLVEKIGARLNIERSKSGIDKSVDIVISEEQSMREYLVNYRDAYDNAKVIILKNSGLPTRKTLEAWERQISEKIKASPGLVKVFNFTLLGQE